MGVDWYQMESGEVVGELGSSDKGLSAQEAHNRLKKYGPNELEEKKKKTAVMMLMDQFTDFMIIVLMAAAVVAGVAGKPTDAVAIIAIVILNAIIGFVQEYRADKAMAALKKNGGIRIHGVAGWPAHRHSVL
jgi:Ca2+-transporting ATPase